MSRQASISSSQGGVCGALCGIIMRGFHLFLKTAQALNPFVWLAARIAIARVFFLSGLTKIGNWETTLMLFEDEYQVPLLPVSFAAYSSTFFELAMPVLLVLGLGTRLATLPLLAMTAVIQFTYMEHTDHLYWALLLGLLLVSGPGKLSVDHWLRRKWEGK